MFSQWATKRVCKFFMKRLLGRMLRSELDLEQLEVQLGFGSIQLKDLHLNTEYLNDQLGDAAVAIKEGSIGNVKAKIPWKVLTAESCEIEVDDLKLVVVPRIAKENGDIENCFTSTSDELRFVDAQQGPDRDVDGNGPGGAYLGVDDGVRMIARMVERVLLGLQVRVTNLVIIFEEQIETSDEGLSKPVNSQRPSQQSTFSHCKLIARVAYLEYGVEAPFQESMESMKVTNGAEPSMLVKVVKFQGATIEVADMVEREVSPNVTGGLAGAESLHNGLLSQPELILAGEDGGITGSMQLSVPWKDGTINVPKVHADFVISPVKLKVSPNQIQQFLSLTQAFSQVGTTGGGTATGAPILNHSIDNAASLGDMTKTRSYSVLGTDRDRGEKVLGNSSGSSMCDKVTEADPSNTSLLPVTQFISDWMHWAGSESHQKDVAVAEADLAASVDEFFECFDGTRSSQGGFGSSGIWNWTRSAFSVITAASTLAAGSIVVPPDPPKQVEYSMKARIAGISMDLFYDFTTIGNHLLAPRLAEYSDVQGAARWNDIGVEHLEVELSELFLSVMVSGSQLDCNATIKDLDIAEVVHMEITVTGAERQSGHGDGETFPPQTQALQLSIEDALPSFPATTSSCFKLRTDRVTGNLESPDKRRSKLEGVTESQSKAGSQTFERRQLLGVLSGPEFGGRFTVKLESPPVVSDSDSGRTEITAFLQPLVIWLDVHTLKRIELLIERSKGSASMHNGNGKVAKSMHEGNGTEAGHEELQKQPANYHHRNMGIVEKTGVQKGSFHVNFVSSCVRVIICFPVDAGLSSTRIQKDFIALDLSAPAAKLGIVQPILVYKHMEENQTNTLSTSGDESVLLQVGSIAANLVCGIDECQRRTEFLPFISEEIFSVTTQDSTWGSLPTLDRLLEKGASLEIQWRHNTKIGSWITKRTWDGIAAQQRQGGGGRGIGGSNSEFAAATTAAEAVEEENSQLRKELISSSSSVVRINMPQVKLKLSVSQYTRVLELIGCFTKVLAAKDREQGVENSPRGPDYLERTAPTDAIWGASHSTDTPQTCILLQCGVVDTTLYLEGQQSVPTNSKHGTKVWDWIRFDVEKLQVLSVSRVGGIAQSSYLWVYHQDGQVTGSLIADDSTGTQEESEMLLLSCKTEALGRGDGGGGNALAAGRAGLTVTYMVWPGQEQIGDVLFTGTIRGSTFVAHGGRLDWLPAVTTFFNSCEQKDSSEEITSESISCGPVERTTDGAGVSSVNMHTYFLLDLHDVALGYEPGSEAMLVPGVRTGRDSQRRGGASSIESSQVFAPVACVLAAAAVRVSSSGVPRKTGEQYDIWLRDVALHLLDTSLRKHLSFDYMTDSMKSTGYVQIAKEAVMKALVRIDGEDRLKWEVECANSQLRFDTCHDTTAAFGRLVAQIQQLFAPEIEQSNVNVNSRKGDQRGPGYESPLTKLMREGGSNHSESSFIKDPNEIDLFEGVLEDAFSRFRTSWSSVVGDDDELSEGAHTVINIPLHSRVSSMDRREFLERDRQESPGTLVNSAPSTPTQLHSVVLSPPEESLVGLPTFIEDYYMTMQKQAYPSQETLFSIQSCDSPQQSAGPSRQASRESTSSGGGSEAEGKGGWYVGSTLKLMENHVPQESPGWEVGQESGKSRRHEINSHNTSRKSTLPKKYPSSIGRVVLSDLKAKWRFYGGSDWPTSRVAGQDPMSKSNTEETGRQSGVCLEVLLNGMGLQYDTFPAVGIYASRLVVTIQDINVYDDSSNAPWRTVLSYNRSKSRPRESSSQAVKIEMDAVRPDPLAPLEEYRLSISLLPICLHLDQRHIDFCIQFFSSQTSSTTGGPSTDEGTCSSPGTSVPASSEFPLESNDLTEEALVPFFQICEMRPLTIRVDYLPRRVDLMSLRAGNYAELLNLVSWKGIELNLKHVRASGVHGWSSLSGVMFGEWLEDISQNQVHKFVRGMGPIRPLYAVGSGAAKLVVLPVEHYRKDRRVLRGMRKGAIAFLRSISLEALGLGAHLAAGAHEILQQTELALGGAPIPLSYSSEKGERRSKAMQPGDTREGLQQACESISRGLERTASSLLGNPLKVYQRGAGAGLAVASALRAAPAAAVAPASAAAGAVHRALLGVRNELDPDKKRESDEKHAGPPADTRRTR